MRTEAVIVMLCLLGCGARGATAQSASLASPFAAQPVHDLQPAPLGTSRAITMPTPAHAHAAAQQAERRVSAVIGIGKWVTLGAAAASAVYGFSESSRADDLYNALEVDCQANPDTCRGRDPSGRYLDSDFEQRYQDVLSIDRRTRQALVVSQVSLLASAILFVLDLRSDTTRPDVPYTPPQLRLTPAGLEASVEVKIR